MRITRVDAVQAHPVPKTLINPRGPFPVELFDEPEIIDEYDQDLAEDGSNFPVGATVQNNYAGPRKLVCSSCDARVFENKTGDHECDI
jgi:hypothetical protein